jgi:hypothetical protein
MDETQLKARQNSYKQMIENHKQDIIELGWMIEKMEDQIAGLKKKKGENPAYIK